jgi:hypothetical protein
MRPEHKNSLRLLPSGSDRVGERFVRCRPPTVIIAVLGGEVASAIRQDQHNYLPEFTLQRQRSQSSPK